MNKLLIVARQYDDYRKLLAQAQLPALEITEDPAQASIILADPPRIAAYLERYPALRWLQSTYAGIDALIRPDIRQDYTLTNIRGHFGQLIAEYVMGYTLDHTRQLSLYRQQQSQAQWRRFPYSPLDKRTMVILGTGSIGTHLARVAKAFGLEVIGINRSGQTGETSFDRIYPLTQLADGLATADILVSTLPATTETDDLFNARTLSHCRNTLLFNVGRGNAVCEQGLLTAIEQGCVTHAYLDVFKQEPLNESHPFWQNPNITITPHIAAESFPEQVFEIFKANYQRYIQQQPMMYQVDFNRGY
ncbi:D-2-hydroxyacid dehydrogenase [Photobacterium chitinilyticum]|uniref:D-2-hydroxyacid dehydrogenase n=1 Tax=Photobacterium chitinilyticum TaxID=2485123 RepID=A0A444JL57_9GAMM|nr:D-2-hydroxyacid dehydrogenase [Photobacterium chitinilyticum]RWX53814.1 D-2-hydroxyacid dehydrogenase [Photobacterium chitinilyticum]